MSSYLSESLFAKHTNAVAVGLLTAGDFAEILNNAVRLEEKNLTAEDHAEIRENAEEVALFEEIRKSQQEHTERYIRFAVQAKQNINPSAEEIENARYDAEMDVHEPGPIGFKQNLGHIKDAPYMHYKGVRARTYKKRIPLWAVNDSKIKELIQRSFPNWKTNPRMRDDAGRWAAVINLYYRNGYTVSQIAHEIGSTECKVRGVIRSIQRAVAGRRAGSNKPRTNNRGKDSRSRRKPLFTAF